MQRAMKQLTTYDASQFVLEQNLLLWQIIKEKNKLLHVKLNCRTTFARKPPLVSLVLRLLFGLRKSHEMFEVLKQFFGEVEVSEFII